MNPISYRKVTYIISGILLLFSLAALSIWGLKLGIDFTGGSLLEVEYRGEREAQENIVKSLQGIGIDHAVVQPTGERGVFIRTRHMTEDEHQKVLTALRGNDVGSVIEKRFDTIGPTIGAELARKSIYAILLVIALIILYIAWAFRHVSEPISSWKYGIATVIALVHDVMIPVGIFAALGHFYGTEIDTLFVTAVLTILGFSVHDTIVVFDRIRERLKDAKKNVSFENLVGESISETITRSINTSLTVLLVLSAIYFFGGDTVRNFALALIIGIGFGTYSSIFLASPILVTWNNWSQSENK